MLTFAVLAGVAMGCVGRRPARYGAVRATGLVLAAALLQLASTHVGGPAHAAVLTASIGLAALWLLVQRRHLASVLLGLGAAANIAVIAVNGGMPVDPAALRAVGRGGVDVSVGFLSKHVALDASTRLAFLADRIPVPVQRNVISIGDVLMAVAILLWVADATRGWRYRRSAAAVHGDHPGRELGPLVTPG